MEAYCVKFKKKTKIKDPLLKIIITLFNTLFRDMT